MQIIENWIKAVSLYPMTQISGLNDKAEKRCSVICEELYAFTSKQPNTPRPLAELRAAYREVEVALKLNLSYEVKAEYLMKVLSELYFAADFAVVECEKMFKKDQALWKYYSEVAKASRSGFKKEIVEFIYTEFSIHRKSSDLTSKFNEIIKGKANA